MTEAQAHVMWCPWVRLYSDGNTELRGTNRFIGKVAQGDLIQGTGCLGSECMAWRWTDATQVDGFCGLAGKP